MKLSDRSLATVSKQLRQSGVTLAVGPFSVRLETGLAAVAEAFYLLYGDYQILSDDYADFHVCVSRGRGIRGYYRPQVRFLFDGEEPFKPLPLAHSFPFFEWGLNWCVAQHAHQFCILHSAVVEKNGRVLLMPGEPGSGKSTLCTSLVHSGWRLFSDELALISTATGDVYPIPRPISLKNDSIDIIRRRHPDAVIGPEFEETSKGTVAHVKAPAASVEASQVAARAAFVLFPLFEKRRNDILVEEYSPGRAFLDLVDNSFNYGMLGELGFSTLTRLIDEVRCYRIRYSSLDDVFSVLDELVGEEHG